MNFKDDSDTTTIGSVYKNNSTLRNNLLRLDQLTLRDLGLELFSDTDKFGHELKNNTLESMLLNGDTETYSGSSPVDDSFHSFHDYVPGDMPSLSPAERDTELIEVFPAVTDSTLLNTGVDIIIDNKRPEVVLNTLNSTLDESNTSKLKILPAVNNTLPKKKRKVRRIIKQPKLRKKIMEKAEPKIFPEVKKTTLNGFGEKYYNDNTELDNKINDTLLDMLQAKTGVSQVPLTDYSRPANTEKRSEKDCFKFITILPSKPDGKVINLLVRGKNCRSKQQLTEAELRIVTKILNNENNSVELNNYGSYKNVYYDAESDTNIRYEVKYEPIPEETTNNQMTSANLKRKMKSKTDEEEGKKEGYILNSVARTRCGRISRPPRHVVRDYKRLKSLNESNNDVEDENENNGGYADYRVNDDTNPIIEMKNTEPVAESTLYGLLEPNKRQFSSLSRCPTCDKIYLGHRRMAIHFQKYPEHKNEELLRHLLIRSKKRGLVEDNLNDASVGPLSPNLDVSATSSVPTNGVLKRKGRLQRKLRTRGAKSHQLKELLSSFRVEDIMKYAAPVVATVLNSWEYLLLRSKNTKNDDQTLIVRLLQEVSIVLKQLRLLSHKLLKPCKDDEKNRPNIFLVEDDDVLQYVLGITPGKYFTSEDEDWFHEITKADKTMEKVDIKEEYAALCSSTVNSDEDVSDLIDRQSSASLKNEEETNSFYHLVTQQAPSSFTVTALVHDMEKDLVTGSTTQPSLLNENEHLAFAGDASRLFDNVTEPTHLSLKSDDSSLSVTRLDYLPSSFMPAHTLNFDSLVDGVDDDLMSAFPISLPMLSDNSTDSKDYGEILNSLKGIDETEKSAIPDLSNMDGPSGSSQIDLLSTLKNISSENKCMMDGLRNTITNNVTADTNQRALLTSLKNIDSSDEKLICVVNNLGTVSSKDPSRVNLLNNLKNTDSLVVDMQDSSISNGLEEPSNASCIMDFAALNSNFSLNSHES